MKPTVSELGGPQRRLSLYRGSASASPSRAGTPDLTAAVQPGVLGVYAGRATTGMSLRNPGATETREPPANPEISWYFQLFPGVNLSVGFSSFCFVLFF